MEGGLEALYLLTKSPDEVHPPQSIKGKEKDCSQTFLFLRLRNVTAVVSPNCSRFSLCIHHWGLFWGFFLGLCLVFPTRFSASRGQRPHLDPGLPGGATTACSLQTADASPSHDISCSSRYSPKVEKANSSALFHRRIAEAWGDKKKVARSSPARMKESQLGPERSVWDLSAWWGPFCGATLFSPFLLSSGLLLGLWQCHPPGHGWGSADSHPARCSLKPVSCWGAAEAH